MHEHFSPAPEEEADQSVPTSPEELFAKRNQAVLTGANPDAYRTEHWEAEIIWQNQAEQA